jgi:hypothetical protein
MISNRYDVHQIFIWIYFKGRELFVMNIMYSNKLSFLEDAAIIFPY